MRCWIETGRCGFGGVVNTGCIWENGIPHPNPSSEAMYYGNKDTWYAGREFRTPDVGGEYDRDLLVMKNRISLKGRTLQVFVKLANILLTPERPEYPGGRWHVEGSQSPFLREDWN